MLEFSAEDIVSTSFVMRLRTSPTSVYLFAYARAHAPRKILHDAYHDVACRAGDEICAYIDSENYKYGLYDKVHIYARFKPVAYAVCEICELIGRDYRQKRSDNAEYERNDDGLVPRLQIPQKLEH